MSYGLPTGTNIPYGAPGFPPWVYSLADAFGLKASTYPDHQESERAEAGFAPNPQRLNRGIDWAGSVSDMQRFADYLLSIRSNLEQVIFENPQTGRRVGVAGGDDVSATPYYADDYPDHRDHVHTRQSQPIPLPTGVAVAARPDFNEYAIWSPNNQGRGGVKPSMFLLHTQEGPGSADSLARYFTPANPVSYHYTISQASDNGVTVVDCVDTDLASWSVLDYNNRAINLCFAGSSASWSRAQWMQQSRAIDVAAYLAAQDCAKYGIQTVVVPPPYKSTPGVSDHAYVTHMGVGTHTDVGAGFPWDFFAERFKFWVSGGKAPAPVPAPPPAPPPAADLARLWTEWNAIIFSDQPSILALAQQAQAGDGRSADALERVNPVALQQFIDQQKKGA